MKNVSQVKMQEGAQPQQQQPQLLNPHSKLFLYKSVEIK